MNLNEELDQMGLDPVLTEISPQLKEWERCKPWIEAGLSDTMTLADILTPIAEGRAHFWPGRECAMVTEITAHEDKKIIWVTAAGGDLNELKAMQAGVEAFARLNGCTEARIEGRKGWEKTLKPDGYEFVSVIIRKPL